MSSTDVAGKVSRKVLQSSIDAALDGALKGVPAENAGRVARALFRRGLKELAAAVPGAPIPALAQLAVRTLLDAIHGLVRDGELAAEPAAPVGNPGAN